MASRSPPRTKSPSWMPLQMQGAEGQVVRSRFPMIVHGCEADAWQGGVKLRSRTLVLGGVLQLEKCARCFRSWMPDAHPGEKMSKGEKGLPFIGNTRASLPWPNLLPAIPLIWLLSMFKIIPGIVPSDIWTETS